MLKGLQSLLMPSPFPAAAGCSTTAARSAAGSCPLALLTAETGYDLLGLLLRAGYASACHTDVPGSLEPAASRNSF